MDFATDEESLMPCLILASVEKETIITVTGIQREIYVDQTGQKGSATEYKSSTRLISLEKSLDTL
jgi:hypothetical protein